jgi:hypothetical protein
LAIDEIQHAITRLNQRDMHVQRAENYGVFHTNDAGTNNAQLFGQMLQFQDFIAIKGRFPIKWNVVRAKGDGLDGQ